VKTTNDAKLGKILVDGTGRTLYVFDKDTGGTIACVDPCTSTWPPLLTSGPMASPSMSGIGTVKRPDGATQVAYKGRPLYRYSGDTKPGDTNGDGVGGLWHAAKVS
jgi:predicted lipoprotein with Yx(FWY)xxD motif